MSQEGKKFDNEKVPMDLLSPIALEQIAKVMAFGAKKYDRHNWRAGIAWSRIIAASLRHIFSFLKGEDKDPETGLSHIAHAACCLMFLLTYEDDRKEFDDRYKDEAKEACGHKYVYPVAKYDGTCLDCKEEVKLS